MVLSVIECGKFSTVFMRKLELTIHLYNKPKTKKGSKIMIQGGRQSLICSYVFEELPRIYREVCKNRPKVEESMLKVQRNQKPCVKCEQCKFKSSLIQMKMHMKTVLPNHRRGYPISLRL